ncbi:polyprenyl synthetase family protein [Kitasatospora viridis]|uniref:Heptaprenyl diphosphate synthase n=1 Tax=Kitasatospora viridis TaxID=281105 RepID=A0A561UCK4_9ACTN|nr:polyprenyl synthetase family protein [Kitasatospora viridis]TWF97079.1 heptaprenyl diphosphate synthase [Kitasatospora viridis]
MAPTGPTGPTGPSQEFPQLLGDLSRVHDRVIKELTLDDADFEEALQHLLRRPGKFLRPALALTAAYLVGGDAPAAEQVVTAGAAVELLHTATLYHDDLCDQAVVRRGRPTVNARYGDSTALVLGDYLLSTALGLAASLGPEAAAAGVRCAQRICLGQLTELREAGRTDRSVHSYLAAIAGKTAALTSYSALLGAIAAGADERQRTAIAAFGHHLGLAFQIWNDLGDLHGPAEAGEPGKGRDLWNGVYTLPVLYGLESAGDALRPLLGPELSEDAAAEVAEVLRRSGAVARAAEAADEHLRTAFGHLDGLGDAARGGVTALRGALGGLLPELADFVGAAAGANGRRTEGT